jgi:hypothetical protein
VACPLLASMTGSLNELWLPACQQVSTTGGAAVPLLLVKNAIRRCTVLLSPGPAWVEPVLQHAMHAVPLLQGAVHLLCALIGRLSGRPTCAVAYSC